MARDDALSDEAVESQIGVDSAEPASAKVAETPASAGSPFLDRLKQISDDVSGRIPPPDPL